MRLTKFNKTFFKKYFDVKLKATIIPQGLGLVFLRIPIENHNVKLLYSFELNLVWFKFWVNLKLYSTLVGQFKKLFSKN